MLDSAHPSPSGAPLGTRLAIRIIGGLSLSVGGTPLALNHRRARLTLAYLALNDGRPVARERLVGLLWDGGERQSRAAFRTELYELSKPLAALGCLALEKPGSDLRLVPGSFSLDLTEALEAVAAGRVPAALAAQPQACAQILAGFEEVSKAARAWIEEIRAATGRQLHAALDAAMASPDLPRPARRGLADLAMRIDPLDEAACRTAMRLAAEDGEIGAALKAYAALYEALGADLDMEPSEETQVLVAAIKTGRMDAPARVAPVLAGKPPPVAVLPFFTLAGEPLPRHLTDGLTVDIICQLAGLREMQVISHGSTLAYRDPTVDLRGVGRELGVRYVVRGTIRRQGNHLRLTTELVDTASGAVVWARTHDTAGSLSFADQDRVVGQIVNTLAPRVHELELARIRGKRPDSLSVYDKVLLAREHLLSLKRDAFSEAQRLLDEVLAIEPGYAEAYALMADCHAISMTQGWLPDRAGATTTVEDLTRTALSLDGENCRALMFHAHRRSLLHRDYDAAMQLFDYALSLWPGSAATWSWSSYTWAFVGQTQEAIRRVQNAIELSPRDREAHHYYSALCVAHYIGGDYAEAAAAGRRALEDVACINATYRWTAAALAGCGELSSAREMLRRGNRNLPGMTARHIVSISSVRDISLRHSYANHLIAAGLNP